jgi:hypothetical protein
MQIKELVKDEVHLHFLRLRFHLLSYSLSYGRAVSRLISSVLFCTAISLHLLNYYCLNLSAHRQLNFIFILIFGTVQMTISWLPSTDNHAQWTQGGLLEILDQSSSLLLCACSICSVAISLRRPIVSQQDWRNTKSAEKLVCGSEGWKHLHCWGWAFFAEAAQRQPWLPRDCAANSLHECSIQYSVPGAHLRRPEWRKRAWERPEARCPTSWSSFLEHRSRMALQSFRSCQMK